MKIIFICTGNTCRSPMAKVIAEAVFSNMPISFASAGVAATSFSPASELALAAAKENGLDLSDHVSKAVTEGDLAESDLALTMTESHKLYLLGAYPKYEKKIFTICEYSTGLRQDVADPFGGGNREYDSCFKQLRKLMNKLKKKLKGGVK